MMKYDFHDRWFDSRLKKKYAKKESFTDLLKRILFGGTKKVSKKVADKDQKQWEALRRDSRMRNLIIPPAAKVMPEDSVLFHRSRLSSQAISETMRKRISDNIKTTLKGIDTHKPVSAEMIRELRKRLKTTFAGYTKKDARFSTTAYINTISTTELGAAINQVKQEYVKHMKKDNPGLIILKKWVHTKRHPRGYKPRIGHQKVDGITIPEKEMFTVPNEDSGSVQMFGPHDRNAPAHHVINCLCSLVYKTKMAS